MPQATFIRLLFMKQFRAEDSNNKRIEILLSHGAKIDAIDDLGVSGLCKSILKNKFEVAAFLLENGADANVGNPLRKCGSSRVTDPIAMAKLLVNHGADPNQVDTFADGSRVTALDWYLGSNPEIAEYLLSIGAKTAEQVLGVPQVSIPSEDVLDAALVTYFAEKFGPVATGSIQQIIPDIVNTKIRWVPPGSKAGMFGKRTETYLLFTVGMSRRPQYVPFGEQDYRFAELSVELPPHWPSPAIAIQKPETAWPIQWLQKLAAYPEEERSWLGGPISIISHDKAVKPLGPGCPFSAWMLSCNTDKSETIQCKDGTNIVRYICYPIYKEEFLYERRHGTSALMELFIENGLPEIVFLDRPNFAML